MYIFEEKYINKFMADYLCPLLIAFIEMLDDEDFKNEPKFKALFPLFNNDIKEEILSLSRNDYLRFYEKHEDFFKASSSYEKTLKRAKESLVKENLIEKYKKVIECLNMANIISGVNGNLLVACTYGKSNLDFYEFDDTKQRIEIAKEMMNLKNHTTDEVFNLILNKCNEDEILTLRNDNAILMFCSLDKMEILYARYVDTKLPWKIEKVNGTEMEQIKYIKFDDYNREIIKDYELEDFF